MKRPSHLPTVLHFEIGGYNGPCHEVRWQGGQLACRHAPGAYMWQQEPRACHPSPEQWQQFWAAAATAGVWNWDRDYTNLGVLDGTQWSLKLSHAGRRVRCAGSNAFPGSAGPNYYPGCAFDQFLAALQQLTGLNQLRAPVAAPATGCRAPTEMEE